MLVGGWVVGPGVVGSRVWLRWEVKGVVEIMGVVEV